MLGCRAPELAAPPSAELVEVGQDEGAGNILGVQAWMDPTAYASADNLDRRLRVFLDEADGEGWLLPDTVVVLPEHLATWLVVVNEPAKVLNAPTADKALRRMIPGHLGRFLALRKDAPAEDANQYAIFALKADEIAATWQEVIAGIAVDYDVTVIGGSALLPEPELIGGDVVAFPGQRLRNVSFVMGNDGQIMSDLVLEAYPDADEQDVVEPGAAVALSTSSTPLGEVALLLGDDAWYPTAWAAMSFGQPRVAISPHYYSPDGAWTSPWDGYTGFEQPSDVSDNDVRDMTLRQAEQRYGLSGRTLDEGLSEGLMVPLRGHIWDLGSDGAVVLVHQGEITEGPVVDAPVLANLWLPLR